MILKPWNNPATEIIPEYLDECFSRSEGEGNLKRRTKKVLPYHASLEL